MDPPTINEQYQHIIDLPDKTGVFVFQFSDYDAQILFSNGFGEVFNFSEMNGE